MVFNVDYNSNKGLKTLLFAIIILVLMFFSQFIIRIAMDEQNKDDLKALGIGTEETTTIGHWEIDTDTGKVTWVEEDITGRKITGPLTREQMNAESGSGGIDMFGAISGIWDTLTFNIIPFPYNLIPSIIGLILILFITFFITSMLSGFVPSWL